VADGHAEDDALEAARQRSIADACLLDGHAAEGRLGLYRRLIQGNLAAIARRLLPRTAAALDAAHAGAFDACFARFLAELGPHTPYLRDVPAELVAWATPQWGCSTDAPPFVTDLARYEIDLFQIESAPKAASPPPLAEVMLDRPLVFATPRRLARYDYAVHEPMAEVPLRETHLFIHRDDENTVRTTQLDSRRSQLLELLLDGQMLGDALRTVAANPGEEDLRDLAEWLAALGASGALLGAQG
jgi:hypothetical protein